MQTIEQICAESPDFEALYLLANITRDTGKLGDLPAWALRANRKQLEDVIGMLTAMREVVDHGIMH